MEKWKGIAGFQNYEVSNRGQVRSLPRLAKCGRGGGGVRQVVGRIIKMGRRNGYPWVGLFSDGHKPTSFAVHRLVLDAFRGPKSNPRMVCRHLDGDPLNNRLANLVWGTHQENADDMKRHGRTKTGVKHRLAKLTDKKVLNIRRLYATGEYTMAAIATAYRISITIVYFVVRRKRWTHI